MIIERENNERTKICNNSKKEMKREKSRILAFTPQSECARKEQEPQGA